MSNNHTLVIIRGLPGSGKSTYAKMLKEGASNHPLHYEADMFFEDPDGVYRYDVRLIKHAHAWCQAQAARGLSQGRDVIVSNTFVLLDHVRPYVELAKQFNADVTVIECTGEYKNVHGVPRGVIDRMKSQWEEWREDLFDKDISVHRV